MDRGTHLPVLLRETVAALGCRPGGIWVDGTVGAGGHSEAILRATAPDGRLLACDRDPHAVAEARRRLAAFAGRVDLRQADFRSLPRLLDEAGLAPIDGALLDLGVSSMQLDDPGRGFSFRQAGPLDMRMDPSRDASLADRLKEVEAGALADVIWTYGEERHSRRVARAIVAARDRGALVDTVALAAVVRRAAGNRGWQRIDPATRTFQALRIWVNAELEGLEPFLVEAAGVLAPAGRLAVIAFHSLEDRVVKHTFRRLAGEADRWRLVTRRPVVPGADECARNPRARSARLRVLERVA